MTCNPTLLQVENMGNNLKGLERSASPTSSSSNADSMPSAFYPLQDGETISAARMNVQLNYLLKQLFQTKFMGVPAAALTAGMKVLHAGATSGSWLLEMEREFPASKFFAVSFQLNLWPEKQRMRATRTITIRESESLANFAYEDSMFDYVYEHSQFSITPIIFWPQGIKEFLRVLKPGGFLDIVELEPFPAVAPTPLVAGYISRILPLMRAGGIDLRSFSKIADILEATGSFMDIQIHCARAELGWDAEIGGLWRLHLKEGNMGLRELTGMAMTGGTTVPTVEEFSRFLDNFFEDCANGNAYCNVYRITARKKLLQ
ncbi:hypothetical protein BJ742DRAFT_789671 [Cladochytrium replicatum]|nr:hypothetical protein BJ742DRAFT_789671 [Cladochytrium replicatum]